MSIYPAINPEPTVDCDDERFDKLFFCAEHEYYARWDYSDELRVDLLDHPLAALAQARLDFLATLDDTPFTAGRAFPADLSALGAVGLNCSGTYNEPVVLIDLALLMDPDVMDAADETRRTVDHEITHAIQESEWNGDGDWRDEDDAESRQFPLS